MTTATLKMRKYQVFLLRVHSLCLLRLLSLCLVASRCTWFHCWHTYTHACKHTDNPLSSCRHQETVSSRMNFKKWSAFDEDALSVNESMLEAASPILDDVSLGEPKIFFSLANQRFIPSSFYL